MRSKPILPMIGLALFFLLAVVIGVALKPPSIQAPQTPTPSPTPVKFHIKPCHGLHRLDLMFACAGDFLASTRLSNSIWADGSNWHDGRSHLLPELPLDPGTSVLEEMTCTQWENLTMISFPAFEDPNTWQHSSRAEEIAAQWMDNLAKTIWGDVPGRLEWLQSQDFLELCGTETVPAVDPNAPKPTMTPREIAIRTDHFHESYFELVVQCNNAENVKSAAVDAIHKRYGNPPDLQTDEDFDGAEVIIQNALLEVKEICGSH